MSSTSDEPHNGHTFDSDYVFHRWIVHSRVDFEDRFGPDTTVWPNNALPAYEFEVGVYLRGTGAGTRHVEYCLDKEGMRRCPVHTGPHGENSWCVWRQNHGLSTV